MYTLGTYTCHVYVSRVRVTCTCHVYVYVYVYVCPYSAWDPLPRARAAALCASG